MVAGLTWADLLEWQEYARLEPFDEERADARSAQIVQALYNLFADRRGYPDGFPLADFLLIFGDAEAPPRTEKPKQDLAYQEMLIDAWCDTQNAIVARQGAR